MAMELRSRLNTDAKEKILFWQFLDKNLYRPLEQLVDGPHSPLHFQRVNDINYQKAGVDIIMTEGSHNEEIFIDEKAQLHNLNENIPTFAFELSYIKGGEPEAGWLLDTAVKTAGYMLCWPFGIKNDGNDEYRRAKVLFVSKRRILSYLDAYGFSRRELARRDEAIRENGHPGRFRTRNNNFWFYFSKGKYAEAPINIVIRVPLLQELASADLTVEYDPEQKTSTMQGHWLHRPVNGSVLVA